MLPVSRAPSSAPPALDIAGQGLTKVVVKKYNCAVLLPNALFPDAVKKFGNSNTDHIQSVNECASVTLRADSQSLKRVYEKVIAEFSSDTDPKAIDYKVLKDGWFVVSGDSKTAGYYTKGVRRRSDVLLLELSMTGPSATFPMTCSLRCLENSMATLIRSAANHSTQRRYKALRQRAKRTGAFWLSF